MRIEIIMGHTGSRSYYQIERPELIIGSSTQCHVILPNPEVSRRHLALIQRGDRYFVIDHSSTNGTFINEERLEPNQKIEWRPGIPMRIANGVIMTLVEDASDDGENYVQPQESRINPDHTRTMVIPLAQLKATSKKKAPARSTRVKKKKNGMGKAVFIVAALLGLAYYLNVEKGIKIKHIPKSKAAPADN